jgi:hypothetical protein
MSFVGHASSVTRYTYQTDSEVTKLVRLQVGPTKVMFSLRLQFRWLYHHCRVRKWDISPR